MTADYFMSLIAGLSPAHVEAVQAALDAGASDEEIERIAKDAAQCGGPRWVAVCDDGLLVAFP